jgi:hypothetical protein
MDELDDQQQDQQQEQQDQHIEQPQGDEAAAESQAAETQADDAAAAESADEVVISFGDEAEAANEDEIEGKPAPGWVKELRKEAKELKRRNRELEAEKTQREAANQAKEDPVGEMPTLESCDYDAEAYADAKLAWTERKRAADAKAAAARQAQEAEHAAWQGKVSAYRAAGASLKAAGFEDAESVVLATLSPIQQNILVDGPKTAEVSAQLVTALGRNPAKLKELAAISNPVKYAFAVAELVGQLKVQSKKQPPAPERQVRGTTGATSIDNTLAKLEEEADRTGDRSKIAAYRRQQREKAAKAA